MKRGADIQDLSAVLLQLREGRATHVERSFKINVDDGSESIWRKLFRRTQEVSCRAVNHNIKLAEAINRGCNRGSHSVRFAHVCRHGHSFATISIDCFGSGL